MHTLESEGDRQIVFAVADSVRRPVAPHRILHSPGKVYAVLIYRDIGYSLFCQIFKLFG
ncbi:MAG: hypothetical protein K2J58_05665 [Muribaculaceae bacterium]|nr:hypothetical protein [Muribaculaceae bacterium]